MTVDLFTSEEDAILAAAKDILDKRISNAANQQTTETKRLHAQYASNRSKETHNLGKPAKLSEYEALLLVAFERNKYSVEVSQGGKWGGDAMCRYHIREGAICFGMATRLDVLIGLWAAVSGQDGRDRVQLTEAHLQGSLVRSHIRDLWREVQAQELMASESVED